MSKIKVSLNKGFTPWNSSSLSTPEARKSFKSLLHRSVTKQWVEETLEWKQDVIEPLVTSQPILLGYFEGGHKTKENLRYNNGIMIDFDNGMATFNEVKAWQNKVKFNSILTTSLSHNDEHHKLHLWLPFESGVELRMEDVYNNIWYFLNLHFGDKVDKSTLDRERYFAPGLPAEIGGLVYGIYDKEFFNPYQIIGNDGTIINKWCDSDYVKVGKEERQLGSLDIGTRIFCPVCNYNKRGNPTMDNAVLLHKEEHLTPIIHCSSCNTNFVKAVGDTNMYLEYYKNTYSNYFYLGSNLYKWEVTGKNAGYGKVPREAICPPERVIGQGDKEVLLKYKKAEQMFLANLAKSCKIPGTFSMVKKSDVNADRTYGVMGDERLDINYAPAAVDKKDNDYIINVFKKIFDGKGEFDCIMDYMAMAAYTNFKRLPTCVWNGARGTGKSTIAEFIANMFPGSYGIIDSKLSRFNYECNNKFVLLVENDSDKRDITNYTKKLGGSEDIKIEHKGEAPFYIPNNVNLLIDSNNLNALHLPLDEKPTNTGNNQYFVKTFKLIAEGDRNNNIKEELKERQGWFIQSYLRERFEMLEARDTQEKRACRYHIRVPITDDEKIVFNLSETKAESYGTDLWDDYIYKAIVDAGSVPSLVVNAGKAVNEYDDVWYLNAKVLQEAVRHLRMDNDGKIPDRGILLKQLLKQNKINSMKTQGTKGVLKGRSLGYEILDVSVINYLNAKRDGKVTNLNDSLCCDSDELCDITAL